MIPDYQSMMLPVLKLAADGEIKVQNAVIKLADELGLSDEEREQLLPSGKQAVFSNRVHWAKTYLKQAGLLRYPRRGHFEITDRGREVLSNPPDVLNTAFLDAFQDFQEFRDRKKEDQGEPAFVSEIKKPSDATPDEELRIAHRKINDALAADLLDKVREASPAFFEELIVQLLIAMGYGGSSEEAGRALGRAGDDGVDGVIDQDPLGVDQIYIQAKRYAEGNSVGAGAIRDFFGALSLKKAQKGIFVTTSTFSSSATETAKGLGSRIVLIDGVYLARLLVRYGIGCRVEGILEIKKIDEEFFPD